MKEIIERAIKNGWEHKNTNVVTKTIYWCKGDLMTAPRYGMVEHLTLNDLLADEGFVKALFGDADLRYCDCDLIDEFDTDCGDRCGYKDTLPAYKYHCKFLSAIFDQQQKIKYIKENWRYDSDTWATKTKEER